MTPTAVTCTTQMDTVQVGRRQFPVADIPNISLGNSVKSESRKSESLMEKLTRGLSLLPFFQCTSA